MTKVHCQLHVSLPTLSLIHSRYPVTLVYTSMTKVHCQLHVSPYHTFSQFSSLECETIPTTIFFPLSLTTRGPPLSPEPASLLYLIAVAQICLLWSYTLCLHNLSSGERIFTIFFIR